jgi:hypothetical protein
MVDYYKSVDEIRSLVSEFEACSFHPSEFRHHQHLAVVLWYVASLPYDDASERMKCGIQRLAASYGKTGKLDKLVLTATLKTDGAPQKPRSCFRGRSARA